MGTTGPPVTWIIWVEQTRENYKFLMEAFCEFGLPTSAIDEKEFLSSQKEGIQFSDSFSRAAVVIFDDVPVSMIDFHDLIRNKKAVGRNKDLDDIEHIT